MTHMTLYHYVHCPYCVRVRMALGYLKVEYDSVVLPYSDEATPMGLTGVKMLPIMKISGIAMNESLDIIQKLDEKNVFHLDQYNGSSDFNNVEALVSKLSNNVHNLAMPYWVWLPEFHETSRRYFEAKKSKKRGPFKELIKRKDEFTKLLNKDLALLELELKPFYQSETFGFKDIQIASFLWGMYVVHEFQFSPKIHSYLQMVGFVCNFNYYQEFWK